MALGIGRRGDSSRKRCLASGLIHFLLDGVACIPLSSPIFVDLLALGVLVIEVFCCFVTLTLCNIILVLITTLEVGTATKRRMQAIDIGLDILTHCLLCDPLVCRCGAKFFGSLGKAVTFCLHEPFRCLPLLVAGHCLIVQISL